MPPIRWAVKQQEVNMADDNDYRWCDECKVEHDAYGRTREENARAKERVALDPAAEARSQLEEVKRSLARDPENDPSLTTSYVANGVANPTDLVKSLQITYTRAATMALKVRNAVTGEPQEFAPGDAIAALVRTAIDGVCATHDALEPEGRERVLAIFTSAVDDMLARHREKRPEIMAQAAAQRKMLTALVQSLEIMVEVAEQQAARDQEKPLPLTAAALPSKQEGETAEEAAARVRQEQALLIQFTKNQGGKVH
jgi:hypothetical protein